ncbi:MULTISPECIES: Spx/MgsR family RNA polymerase-binding regulatory protein [Halomonadaceae]|uniref:Spx/MgsR family RNA polymerase-binding regulatory protein n=1 Tax=Halomonadaceae TaxID=28256 RepID=UPI0015972167|nr:MULTISPECIES: Spx/MgsR family RNA polymerase-binding regulatory protein [Halomonas]QJQ95026.1 Spx/MgsR family RNA polymerase-binding regulatory protein [Halomonas sp. PA5]
MTTLYGIKNCDTCRKARKALDSQSVAYRFHDLRQNGLDDALLDHLLGQVPLASLINRQSQTWRKLDDADKARIDSEAKRVLAANPTLLKRPLLDTGNEIRVGYRDGDYADLHA